MGIKRQSPGKWQVFSETGAGAGWKLYTYIPGTTDNKLTHQDKDGSVNNTNPVIFDSRGEADIWWNGTYDLKLTDENDVLVWTLSDFGAGEGQVNYGNYNLITDGGFEDDSNGDNLPDQWTVTAYPTAGAGAGVVIIDTTDQLEGANSLKFTSVGDGGGYAVSNFFNVREGGIVAAQWSMKSTVAGVRNVVEIIWYTSAQVQISTSSLYDDSTTNPTSWTQKNGSATAVSTARYAKLRIYGCHSSDATSGSTWYDDVKVVADTIFGDLTIVNDLTVQNDLTVTGNTNGGAGSTLTYPTINASTALKIGGTDVTATAGEVNYNDIATLGTVEASKTVTADANKDVTGFRNISWTGTGTGTATDLDINGATAETSISTTDELFLYDSSATANRKATVGNVASAGNGASLSLIAVLGASSSANLNFTGISSSYDNYLFVIDSITPATDAVDFRIRTSTDGGSTYDSGVSDYGYANTGIDFGGTTRGAQSTGANAIVLTHIGVSNGTATNLFGTVMLYNPLVATQQTVISSDISYYGSATAYMNLRGMGARLATADVDAIRFEFSSGNIASGTIRVFGVKNS